METWMVSVVYGRAAHCRMCLRTDRPLLGPKLYRETLTKMINFKNIDPIPNTARVCNVCNAMLLRCTRIIDALIKSHRLAICVSSNPVRKTATGVFLAEQELLTAYHETTMARDSAGQLCITETLNIDTPAAAPAVASPIPPPATPQPSVSNIAGIGNNIILVPAYGNNVLQLMNPMSIDGNNLQLINGNILQLQQSPQQQPQQQHQQTESAAPDSQRVAVSQASHVAKPAPARYRRQAKADELARLPVRVVPTKRPAESPALLTPTPPTPLKMMENKMASTSTHFGVKRVEDDDCIAYIETNIAHGQSDGLCIVPDSLDEDYKKELDPLGKTEVVIDLDSEDEGASAMHAERASTTVRASATLRGQALVNASVASGDGPQQNRAGIIRVADAATLTGGWISHGNVLSDTPETHTSATHTSATHTSATLTSATLTSATHTSATYTSATLVRTPSSQNVDWEDQIPMEVISYADDDLPNGAGGSGMGQIVSIESGGVVYVGLPK